MTTFFAGSWQNDFRKEGPTLSEEAVTEVCQALGVPLEEQGELTLGQTREALALCRAGKISSSLEKTLVYATSLGYTLTWD